MGRVRSSLAPEANQFRAPQAERSSGKRKRLGAGKKTKAWDAIRAVLKKRFRAVGIVTCEATFPHDCWRDTGLSFAHSKKRREIVGNEIYEVALLCLDAHNRIEILPRAEMKKEVLRVISERQRQP